MAVLVEIVSGERGDEERKKKTYPLEVRRTRWMSSSSAALARFACTLMGTLLVSCSSLVDVLNLPRMAEFFDWSTRRCASSTSLCLSRSKIPVRSMS